MLLCGGSSVSDTADPMSYSTQTPASDQCVRMTLTPAGIAKGWEVERLPEPRVMGEGVLLLDERVLIVNGAQSGVAGYGELATKTLLLVVADAPHRKRGKPSWAIKCG